MDTSMGFTPLAGLPMGARSGDLDAGILQYLMKKNERDGRCARPEVRRSGCVSSVLRLPRSGECPQGGRRGLPAWPWVWLTNYRCLEKRIGGYAGEWAVWNTIIFTASMGENSASQRMAIAA
ncbi:MAG: acetate kinase, partial [Dysosmobacter sp.]